MTKLRRAASRWTGVTACRCMSAWRESTLVKKERRRLASRVVMRMMYRGLYRGLATWQEETRQRAELRQRMLSMRLVYIGRRNAAARSLEKAAAERAEAADKLSGSCEQIAGMQQMNTAVLSQTAQAGAALGLLQEKMKQFAADVLEVNTVDRAVFGCCRAVSQQQQRMQRSHRAHICRAWQGVQA